MKEIFACGVKVPAVLEAIHAKGGPSAPRDLRLQENDEGRCSLLTIVGNRPTFYLTRSNPEAMKHLTTLIFVFALFAGTAIGGAFLDFFNGRSDGDNIVLEWKTRSETNLLRYEIQRKAGTNGDFVSLSTVSPKGSNSQYSYIDRSAYKDAESIYVYRLKIIESGSGPASYSNEITVSHSVSSVKRTWGSIKAMFR